MAEAAVEQRLADDPLAVDASPTKAFFVQIITKDIQLDRAIADLVDNSIDGAKRLRRGEDADYTGLRVDLTVSRVSFEISDNCGGIELETARHYAFKFGRAAGFTDTPFSVGQFGVGMKRALFKMGRNFKVSTTECAAAYEVPVDVMAWLQKDHWDFRIENLRTGSFNIEERGTCVQVGDLYEGVAQAFGERWFQDSLRNQIRTVQQHFMRKGLHISFNGEGIIPTDWQLRSGAGLEPFFARYTDAIDGSTLRTRLYCGVGESSRSHAGWYVFCNGRCILEADQTTRTGWGEVSGEGAMIPKYHNQFARFRGYAFLDCEDAAVLPWNTTKTDLDAESTAYRRMRGRLVDAARPVIDFLNKLDAESDYIEQDRELYRVLAASASVPLERLSERATFTFRAPGPRPPALTSISFKRPPEQVDALREAFEARTAKQTGELAFDYAFERLVDESDR